MNYKVDVLTMIKKACLTSHWPIASSCLQGNEWVCVSLVWWRRLPFHIIYGSLQWRHL